MKRLVKWLGYSQIVTCLIIGTIWANLNMDLFGPFTYQGPGWLYWPDVIATNLLAFYIARLIFVGRAAMMGLITVNGREFHLTGDGKEGGVATVNIRAVDSTIVSDTHPNDCDCDAIPAMIPTGGGGGREVVPTLQLVAPATGFFDGVEPRTDRPKAKPRPIKLFEAVLLEMARSHIDYHAPIDAANLANWIVENPEYGMAFVQPMSINGAISGMTIFSSTRPWVRCADPTQPQDDRRWELTDQGHQQAAHIRAMMRRGEITKQ